MVRPFSPDTAELIRSARQITQQAETAMRCDELGQEACGYLQAALAELRRAMSHGDIALTRKRLDTLLLILDTFTLPVMPAATT